MESVTYIREIKKVGTSYGVIVPPKQMAALSLTPDDPVIITLQKVDHPQIKYLLDRSTGKISQKEEEEILE